MVGNNKSLRGLLRAARAGRGPTTGAAAAMDTKVIIGYGFGSGWIPAFVAKDQGIFARHGIDATLQLIPNASNGPAALMGDSMQIAGLNPTSAILADDVAAPISRTSSPTRRSRPKPPPGWLAVRAERLGPAPAQVIWSGEKIAVPAINSVSPMSR